MFGCAGLDKCVVLVLVGQGCSKAAFSTKVYVRVPPLLEKTT